MVAGHEQKERLKMDEIKIESYRGIEKVTDEFVAGTLAIRTWTWFCQQLLRVGCKQLLARSWGVLFTRLAQQNSDCQLYNQGKELYNKVAQEMNLGLKVTLK